MGGTEIGPGGESSVGYRHTRRHELELEAAGLRGRQQLLDGDDLVSRERQPVGCSSCRDAATTAGSSTGVDRSDWRRLDGARRTAGIWRSGAMRRFTVKIKRTPNTTTAAAARTGRTRERTSTLEASASAGDPLANARRELGRRLDGHQRREHILNVVGRFYLLLLVHCSASFNRCRPRNNRDLTVPAGTLSSFATSSTSYPSIAPRTITTRSFSGSASIAAQRCWLRSRARTASSVELALRNLRDLVPRLTPAIVPPPVEREPPRRPHQPGAERSRSRSVPETLVCLGQCLLGDVLGILAVPQDAVGDAERERRGVGETSLELPLERLVHGYHTQSNRQVIRHGNALSKTPRPQKRFA